jgi:hypothetical protein
MPALPWQSGPSGPRKPFRIGWALVPVVVFHPIETGILSIIEAITFGFYYVFPWLFKIRMIASIVFQFRVVAGTPNSLSIFPR